MLQKLFGFGRSKTNETESNRYGIDTDCSYCPKCEEEYRAEIESCPACSIPLTPGAEKLALLRQQATAAASYSMEISAADELVALQTGKLMNLKQLQQILGKKHIPSILAGGDSSKG